MSDIGGIVNTKTGIVVYYTDECSKVKALKRILEYIRITEANNQAKLES